MNNLCYYIHESKDLASAIEARQEKQEQIAEKIDEWVFSKWGIANFSHLFESSLKLPQSYTYGTLCRQVATARIEEVSFSLTCKSLGLKPLDLTYHEDAFSTNNGDKVHLIKLPLITGHSKNGSPIVKYKKIVDFPQAGMLLNKISIDGNGTNLPKYHRNLREDTFGNDIPLEIDIGSTFKKYLRDCTSQPEYLYEDIDGIRVKKNVSDGYELSRSNPPADWYYPLYLLGFMTGKMVLFETYENPKGNVCDIKKHFCCAMDMIKEEIGLYPLVVEIPPLQLPMMYINEALIEKDNWQTELIYPSIGKNSRIIEVFQNFADQTISLRKNT